MLLSIAIFPLFWNHFWEKNRNKLYVAILKHSRYNLSFNVMDFHINSLHTMVFDYVPFLILLGALFTITGGIF
jgi:hypothetical protein